MVEAVLATDACLADPVRSPGPFLVTGRAVVDHGHAHLRVGHVLPFHRRARPFAGLVRR